MTTAVDALTVSVDGWCGTPSGEYDADGVQWIVSKPTGWFDGPPSRTNFTDRPHHDGSFDGPEYAGARVVTVDGRIGVDDPAQLPSLEKARQRTQALLRYGKGTLRVDGRGESLQALVRRSDTPTCDAVASGLAYDFSVQLTAPDPIRYGTTTRRTAVDLGAPASSGLDFSGGGLSFPLDFGGGAGQTLMYLDNPGTADVLPTFSFTRPVDQPVLTNPDNGGRLEYLGSVMAGQQLAIDCKRKTVLLNGISRRTVMGRSDFGAFAVPHEGVLRVAFGTLAQQLAGARVEAAWLNGYW